MREIVVILILASLLSMAFVAPLSANPLWPIVAASAIIGTVVNLAAAGPPTYGYAPPLASEAYYAPETYHAPRVYAAPTGYYAPRVYAAPEYHAPRGYAAPARYYAPRGYYLLSGLLYRNH